MKAFNLNVIESINNICLSNLNTIINEYDMWHGHGLVCILLLLSRLVNTGMGCVQFDSIPKCYDPSKLLSNP